MQFSNRLVTVTLLLVVLTVAFSLLFNFTIFRYLADGERGQRRVEVEEFWSLRAPLTFGLGALAVVVILTLKRTLQEKQWDESVTVVGLGVSGAVFLAAVVVLIHQMANAPPEIDRRPSPTHSLRVFPKTQWRSLADQTWREERPMGPLLEHGPGLRDFPGYVPFDPCLLKRLSFEGMTQEQVLRVLGPPLPAVYPKKQYLQYKMIESSPRERIANLVLDLDFTMELGHIVIDEHLYPERLTTECR